jgi:hypothetical protein
MRWFWGGGRRHQKICEGVRWITRTHLAGGSDGADGGPLPRSKSASSVTNLGAGVTNVGTSSLSLNDVEVLEQTEVATIEGSSKFWKRDEPLETTSETASNWTHIGGSYAEDTSCMKLFACNMFHANIFLLCRFWGPFGGEYEDGCLLGFSAV